MLFRGANLGEEISTERCTLLFRTARLLLGVQQLPRGEHGARVSLAHRGELGTDLCMNLARVE